MNILLCVFFLYNKGLATEELPPTAPLPAGKTIVVFKGPGAKWPDVASSRFRETGDVLCADMVMVDNISTGLQSPEALKCRLYGLRLCDPMYIASNTKKGSCLAFQKGLDLHFHLYLLEDFVARWPDHAEVLLFLGSVSECKLQVHRGPAPDNPKHPRLTFSVCATKPHEGKALLDLDDLLLKLGILKQDE